jgi:hypothetical protein
MPRRAGWRPGCRWPQRPPLPRWPSAGLASPMGRIFARLCEILNFLAVDSGPSGGKDGLQCTGSTAKPGSTTIFGRPGTPGVHPVIRAHTGTTRGRDKTTAEASRVRQQPQAQGATGDRPSGVMPRVPARSAGPEKTRKPGILSWCALCRHDTPQTQVISAPLRDRYAATSWRPGPGAGHAQKGLRGRWGCRWGCRCRLMPVSGADQRRLAAPDPAR